MEVKPIWYDYATFDEDGDVNGIREDAPPEIKKAYADYQQRIKEYEKMGIPVSR